MPLDHYVPQVHLKNFYSPDLGNRMRATRKRDGEYFECDSRSVCRIEKGNTNDYLLEDRAIEEFLKQIEPQYNSALGTLRNGKIDEETIFTVAGFASYVASCSPTAMRLGVTPIQSAVEATARIAEAKGLLGAGPMPPELGGGTLSNAIASGKITIEVDPKFPQAIGIEGIIERVTRFGNFEWTIVRNPFEDSPFFTSDFPASVSQNEFFSSMVRIVPLAPDLCVCINSRRHNSRPPSLTFPDHHSNFVTASRHQVVAINRAIVRSAENLVFFRDNHPWVAPFIERNRRFRIEGITEDINLEAGTVLSSSMAIQPYDRQPEL